MGVFLLCYKIDIPMEIFPRYLGGDISFVIHGKVSLNSLSEAAVYWYLKE